MRRISNSGKILGGSAKDNRNNSIIDTSIANKIKKIKNTDLIVKKNLWETPDYVKMMLNGTDSHIVGLIKIIRDDFATSPKFIEGISNEYIDTVYKTYIDILNYMNEESKNIKTLDDVRRCQIEVFKIMGCYDDVKKTICPIRQMTKEQKAKLVCISSSKKLPFDFNITKLINASKKAHIIMTNYNNKINNKWEYVQKTINNKKVYICQHEKDNNVFYFGKENKFYNKLPNNVNSYFSSKEEAQDTFENYFKNTRVKVKRVKKEIKINRDGPSYRTKNVTEDDLRKTFNLSSVEFGVSLSNRERQEMINNTYDSFCDLAKILNIKNNQIGLGGILSISFGSRGIRGATAHYDAGKKLINLSRIRGMGSLAHEYGHALDNFILNKSLKNNDVYDLNKYKGYFASSERVYLSTKDEFDKMDDLILSFVYKEKEITNKEWNQNVANILDEYNIFHNIDIDSNIKTPVQEYLTLGFTNKKNGYNVRNSIIKSNFEHSNYYSDSRKGNSPTYYSSINELFARAFETYILEELKNNGQRNEFLVSSYKNGDEIVKNNFFPYPKGDEKNIINKKIKDVIDYFIYEKAPKKQRELAF